jgi:hypothetical protein
MGLKLQNVTWHILLIWWIGHHSEELLQNKHSKWEET